MVSDISSVVEAARSDGRAVARDLAARMRLRPMPGDRPALSRFIALALVGQVAVGLLSDSAVLTFDLAWVYAVAAIGLNVIFGLAGLVSIAQASVMALGATPSRSPSVTG